MKNRFVLLCIALFLSRGLWGQTGWEWQSPLPQGNDLYCVTLFETDHIAIGGDVGTLSVSHNVGDTWFTTSTGLGSRFRSVHFIDALNGWASGEGGMIMKTVDGGQTWKNVSMSLSNLSLLGIRFVNTTTGWLCGYLSNGTGKIFKSSDGGNSWTEVASLPDVWPVYMHLPGTGVPYIVTSDGILKSTDGGVSWNELKFSSKPLYSGFFIDDNTGWVVGIAGGTVMAVIYKTTDGGANWTQQFSNTYSDLFSICFTDAMNGRAFGESGRMVTTADGGQVWNESEISENGDFWSASALGNRMITVASQGLMFQSEDAGATWIPMKEDPIRYDLHMFECIGNDLGWAAGGYGTIVKTTDGGETWTHHGLSIIYDFYDMEMIDQNNGWIAGYMDEGIMVKTNDGGEHWGVTYPGTPEHLNTTSFWDLNLGLAAGSNGVIIKTTDGGSSWQVKSSNTAEHLSCIYFVSSSAAFACGYNGTILKSADGGDTWTQVNTPVNEFFRKIFFTDPQTGWIVGWDGAILMTTDGGNSWINKETEIENDLESVFFSSSDTGWVCGYSGALFQTTDGGNSWNRERVTYLPIFDICMIRGNYGWVAGEDGLIMKKTRPAASPGSFMPDMVPEIRIPVTCYPNPARAEVMIEFYLPADGKVDLQIIDLSGKVVQIEAARKISRGLQRISLNTASLPASLYTCEMIFHPSGPGDTYFGSAKLLISH